MTKRRVPGICAPRIDFLPDHPGGLVAVDSGARKAGVAFFFWLNSVEQALLVDAATIETQSDAELPGAVHAWGTRRFNSCDLQDWGHQRWVVERPKKYVHKARYHKDIDRLLAFISQFPTMWDGQFTPHEWKGNVGSTLRGTKAVHHRRALRALDGEEAEIADGLGHDALDAICLGLYVLGRTGRGGVQCPRK